LVGRLAGEVSESIRRFRHRTNSYASAEAHYRALTSMCIDGERVTSSIEHWRRRELGAFVALPGASGLLRRLAVTSGDVVPGVMV
jgi:hypothetical protein